MRGRRGRGQSGPARGPGGGACPRNWVDCCARVSQTARDPIAPRGSQMRPLTGPDHLGTTRNSPTTMAWGASSHQDGPGPWPSLISRRRAYNSSSRPASQLAHRSHCHATRPGRAVRVAISHHTHDQTARRHPGHTQHTPTRLRSDTQPPTLEAVQRPQPHTISPQTARKPARLSSRTGFFFCMMEPDTARRQRSGKMQLLFQSLL